MSGSSLTAVHPFIRVVILAFDGVDMTLECIRSVSDSDWPNDRMEIVLIDNGSLDDVVARSKSAFPQVRVIEPLKNTGFAGGCNLGIRATHDSEGTDLHPFDFVALVNNDAAVDHHWLMPLVREMNRATDIGAVSPKILLAHRFIEVEVSKLFPDSESNAAELVCISGFRFDGQRADERLTFDEGFSGPAPFAQEFGDEFARWSQEGGRIHIICDEESPQPHRVSLRIGARVPGWVKLRIGSEEIPVRVGAGDGVGPNGHRWSEFDVGSERVDVINNAGSELYLGGSAGDRGFLECDRGQYDESGEIGAWCGGAVLLRKSYLDAVGLFDESLFLYYEDTDLSWRGRLQGWRYWYAPESVVRHHHAQSSGVGSDLFRFQVERNRLLVLAKNAPFGLVLRSMTREFLRFLGSLARDCVRPILLLRRPLWRTFVFRFRVIRSCVKLLPRMLGRRWMMDRRRTRRSIMATAVEKVIRTPQFSDDVPPFDASGSANAESGRPRLRVGVYNLYWETFGGGEMVSAEFAKLFTSRYDVTLLGPEPIDPIAFNDRLGVDLSGCEWKKAANDEAASLLSARFDLFVNCTYKSSAVNRARIGLYYVHFPDHVRGRISSATTSLAFRAMTMVARIGLFKRKAERIALYLSSRMSKADWLDSYSLFISNSVYTQGWVEKIWGQFSTVIYPPVRCSIGSGTKGPSIASVGRFFDPVHGHSKKQLELVTAFGAMCRSSQGVGDWRLVLVGGADGTNREYVMRIKQLARDLPIDIHTNAPRDKLESVLSEASVYWHAGGFGEDERRHPERFEHFGISVVEAMAAGAVPMVYGKAGPTEIVRHGIDGFHWTTLEELRRHTFQIMDDPQLRASMAANARSRVDDFSSERFASNVWRVVDELELAIHES